MLFDYRLQVFQTVAKRLSFSKAAEELHISQPAVSRHIQQIETYFNQQFIERRGNRINLTQAGEVLKKHCQLIFKQYDELTFEVNALSENQQVGNLHITASTTIAQYVLPKILPAFHQKYPEIRVEMKSENTEKTEADVLDQTADVGFIEGKSKNREIAYHPFLADEIVLVVSKGNPLYEKEEITLEELQKIPLLLRETGSGTLQVIAQALEQAGIKFQDLQIEMQLGSSESIKAYLSDNRSAAFLSINTVLKELKADDLYILEVKELQILRDFHYITRQGAQASMVKLFIDFLTHYRHP